MRVAAVPVKPMRDAKSRLDVDDRGEIAIRMLDHVLEALVTSQCFDRIAVVSPDPAVLARAERAGLVAVEQRSIGLNPACEEGAAWARTCGADLLLLAHADLPHLRPYDVRQMVESTEAVWKKPSSALRRARAQGLVALAPDRHGKGTNVLIASPPDVMRFAFGVDSRMRHREAARREGVALIEFVSAGTAFDVDTSADMAETPPTLEAPLLECTA